MKKKAAKCWNLVRLVVGSPIVFAIVITLVSFNAWSAVALVVVPNENFDVEGNGNNLIPFGDADFCDNGIRYQQLYLGSEIGGPMIGSMAFRLDGDEDDVGPVTYTGVSVTLSSTLATHATMSETFADNIGPDAALMYSGDLVADPSVSISGTNPFDFEIDFDSSFEFDGSKANLLVDITIDGCQETAKFSLDVESNNTKVKRFYSADKDSPVGVVDSGSVGLVTQFFIFSDSVVFVPPSMGSGGNWAIDGHTGEGFLFEPLADGRVVIFWFTYDLFGDQMWLLGIANASDWVYDDLAGQDVATVQMFRTGGPSFGPGFDEMDYVETPIGTATFRLNGCSAAEGATGEVDYNLDFGFGLGSYNIIKLYDIYKNDCDS